MRFRLAAAASCALLSVALAVPCLGQGDVGEVSFANSGTQAAQPAFLHGLAQLHNFEYQAAAQDFRKAEEIDPGFAMAYWGEAMTYNHPIWMQRDRPRAMAALSKLGATPEERAAKAPTQREKDYLHTVEILYGDGAKKSRDEDYASAMQKVHETYPQDVDAAAFYALALLGTAQGVRDERIYMQSAAILMPLFYAHPMHPGVAHYLIHSCDDPVHAPLALDAARAYSKIAPNAAHAQHMTSHIFIAMGMWNDVVSANEAATRVESQNPRHASRHGAECGHYAYWLEYGYLEEGRTADALRVLNGCYQQASSAATAAGANGVTDPDDSELTSFLQMRLRYLVDTAEWNGDAAKMNLEPGNSPMTQLYAIYTNGLLAAEGGDLKSARSSLATLDAVEPRMTALFDHDGTAPDDPERSIPKIRRMELEAVILEKEGKRQEAIAVARKAAQIEKSLAFAFGPPFPEKPSYELLGELLMRNGQREEAAAALKEALLRAPNRKQTVSDALAANGDADGAGKQAQK